MQNFVRANIMGFEMDLVPGEYVDDFLLEDPNAYDAKEFAFLSEHLNAGDIFLDIGAYIGLYSLVASRIVGPAGVVVAIEADAYNYQRLSNNVCLNQAANVIAICIGVSDSEENLRLNLNVYGNRGKNSFLMPYPEGVDVKCRALHEILNDLKITHVAGIKMDIEGFEYRVLKKYLSQLQRDRYPGFFIIEQVPLFAEEAGGDAVALLHKAGYRTVYQNEQSCNYILVL